MSNYTKATNFYTKDALSTGNPSKLIKGSEIDAEFNAISTAIATKADTNSPTFTGTVTTPAITATTINTSGNLAFTGTGNRITGDFTSAASDSGRVSIQTSTTNGNTFVNVLPNGTGTIAGYNVYTTATAANTSVGQFQQSGTATQLVANKTGTGPYGDLEFWTNGVKQGYFKSTGGLYTSGAIQVGEGAGSQDTAIEIGTNRYADGNSYIDFHSVAGSGDYDFRILRNAGANENAFLVNAGTGGIVFGTNGSTRMTIDSAGITGNLAPNFTGSNQSLAASGYQKLPGGLIMQWGTISSLGDNVSETITFPLAFPTAVVSFVATGEGASALSDVAYIFRSLTTTNVIVTQMYNSSNVGGRYMAIGY